MAYRICRTVLACVALAVSLLIFPSAILWMTAAWIVCYSVAQIRGRTAWFPLLACLSVLIIKLPDWSPGLVLLAIGMAVVLAVQIWRRKSPESEQQRLSWTIVIGLWILWFAAMCESHVAVHCGHPAVLDLARPIVCLGDSLTTGLAEDGAYPLYLQQMVTAPVINMGRAGITARDALNHLPEALATHPQVVVIELGGHDFLRGYGRTAARESLVQIIEASHKAGADVVIFEIPRGFMIDPFFGLERELARNYDLELIADTAIRQLVLRSPTFPLGAALGAPRLSDDGLHPNAAGALYLAATVRTAVERMYGAIIAKKGKG
jgi:acyl-CoA thioesterase I